MMIETIRTPIERPIRYGIAPTYRCNARCGNCNRFLNIKPWPVDMTLDDLKTGWQVVQENKLTIEKVRFTGGEPLMNPQFREIAIFARDTWQKYDGGRICVFTNGILPQIEIEGIRYRCADSMQSKVESHRPPFVSPADLGFAASGGITKYCHRQRACGRLFDAFGFSFCIFAGAIGRLLGYDPYKAHPILDGCPEICGHCPFTLGVGKAFKLFDAVNAGKIEYPTKTYREAITRLLDEKKEAQFPRFSERLLEENAHVTA